MTIEEGICEDQDPTSRRNFPSMLEGVFEKNRAIKEDSAAR